MKCKHGVCRVGIVFTYRSVGKFFIFFLLVFGLAPGTVFSLPQFRSRLSDPALQNKIDSLLARLTLDEKITLLHANAKFISGGVARLAVPELHYTDGPTGIREELERHSWNSARLTSDSAIFFPTGTALAATWNPQRAMACGIALGEEARARNKDILLAPSINLIRTPLNGRNFEFLSEDPLLTARMSVAFIQGVQSRDVAACVKHFALNNQEQNRCVVDVALDERALRELYLPAFKASVLEGGAYTVMAAYNKYRDAWCAENKFLLNDILKGEWAFQGAVVSDWSGTHSTVEAALNGLDIEMGTERPYEDYYFAQPLLEAVRKKLVPESVINDKVRRVLRVLFACKAMEQTNRIRGEINTPQHSQTAYDLAAESVVLLQNRGRLLPLSMKKIHRLAVIGDNAVARHSCGGFGAGVKAKYEITPLAGLQQKVGKKIDVRFYQGYEKKSSLQYRPYGLVRVQDVQSDTLLRKKAAAAAAAADAAVVFVGLNHDYDTEALDREDLKLPYQQDELVRAVTAANANTVVVIIAGSPVDVNELQANAPAILWGWLNGSEGGHALADILFGDVAPSGKLPFTIPKYLTDSPPHYLKAYPGDAQVQYQEGILLGYRWFATKNIEPAFCFGHGLSYTDFDYTAMKTEKKIYHRGENVRISLTVKNNGPCAAAETVQLYVHVPASAVLRSKIALAAFRKVMLQPGETADLALEIKTDDLAYYDTQKKAWVVETGAYELLAGSSSCDVRQTTGIILQ